MTKHERFLAFANFESVDRVPRRASYVSALRETMTKHLGEDPVKHFDMDDGAHANLRPPADYVVPDYWSYYPEYKDNPDFSIDYIGCGRLGCGFYHFAERISPLRNAVSFKELEEFPYPSNKGWLDDNMLAYTKKSHAEGNFVWTFAGHIYESAWQVRGYEEFLVDLLTQRDWAEYILDRFTENSIAVAEAAARCGLDCLQTGDDVANQSALMFTPALWREVMKPRWAKVIAAARAIKPDIHV